MNSPQPTQYSIQRLLLASLLVAISLTFFRMASAAIREYGSGTYPLLCLALGTGCLLAALACIVPRWAARVASWIGRAALTVFEWLLHWLLHV